MLKASLSQRRAWLSEGMKKIVLRVSSERELLELHKAAKARRLPAELVIDRGLTELPPGTRTALGIGPADERRINQIIEKLKLL
jgi:PTH2 family peptidyl-tRNA hydrolase